MSVNVSMTVNGKAVSAEVEERTLLVTFLREHLRLTGTHVGCDTSQCGACVVHVNGESVKSCTLLAIQAQAASKGIELSKVDTKAILESVFDVASQEVSTNGKFAYPGFGTFTKKYRKARQGRNPQTKQPITIPASHTVNFKPAPKLKDLVN